MQHKEGYELLTNGHCPGTAFSATHRNKTGTDSLLKTVLDGRQAGRKESSRTTQNKDVALVDG